MQPLFSIITVVYNAEATIEATILSVINQRCKDYEYIVIDGNSTDNTLSILNRYKSSITKIVSEPDGGIYDAMNKGIRYATAKWLFFLGADDVFFEADTLQKVSSQLVENHCIYYGNAYFKNREKFYDGSFSKFKFALRNICHQAIFYPLQLLHQQQFDIKYRLLSDYATNLKLYKSHPFRYLNLCVSIFNDAASSANGIDEAFENDKLRLVKENLGLLPYLYAKGRKVVKSFIASKHE